MKATEQYFPMVLVIMLYIYNGRWCNLFESVDEILSYCAVLFCLLTVYGAVQGGSNFQSVNEILKCDHLNESH